MSTRAQLASSGSATGGGGIGITSSSRRIRPLTHKSSLVVAHGFFEGAVDYIAEPSAAVGGGNADGEGHGHLTELGVEKDEASVSRLSFALGRKLELAIIEALVATSQKGGVESSN